MTTPVIPPSPSAADYEAQLAANADESLFEAEEPFALFLDWLAAARASEPNDPNAMALATAGADGLPDCRMVLLKDVDPRGFAFYSNAESAKGLQLASNPQVALLFHWKSLRRQVRVRGPVEPVTGEEVDAYFATRARGARLSAWASSQSRPLDSREALEAAVARQEAAFEGREVGRPPYWRGWRVKPVQMEFWRDRPFRLHDRLRFVSDAGGWRRERLYP